MPFRINPVIFFSAALYQVSWLVLVFMQGYWVPVVLVVFGVLHWRFVSKGKGNWQAVVLFALVGLSTDCLLALLGVYRFDSPIPLWLAVLWLVFAASLPYAFGFLLKNRVLASALAAVAAPSTYWVAIKARDDVGLGAFAEYGLIFVALYWAIIMQLAVSLYNSKSLASIAKNDSSFGI